MTRLGLKRVAIKRIGGDPQKKGEMNMKKQIWITGIMVLMCAVFCITVMAQDKTPAVKNETVAAPNEKEKVEFAKKVSLFYQVVSYGQTQKDPLVLLSAVKLLDDLPFAGIVKPGQDEKSGARFDRTSLLAEAKKFAEGDDELLAVIAKVETPPEKTAVRGYGPGGFHRGYYYGWPEHHRHFRCVWFEICRHGRCEWVCR
jgi:hypothetical protein